ncbi:FAD-dependent oxidoreductase, partial [Candidatus Saccharibacteria bacterium]|nr:FAD-dependent oxidoreductase [Candidatus Saccharibacteria bacterium]
VEVHLNVRVESCTKDNVCLSAGNLGADLIVWTAGSKPSEFFAKNSGVFTLNKSGRVIVNEHLQVKNSRNMYVIGDNADTKYSGMAQTALYNALYVARNILAEKHGKKIPPYRNRRPIYVITVGPKWAIAQIGKRVLSGRSGWSVRRKADLAIFKNFQPYKEALKTWRKAEKMSKF